VRSGTARADGVVGGTGTGSADRSRPAALLGGLTWNDCPLPGEAEDEGIEHATVQLRLKLSADGRVDGAEVVADPGYGFAREAMRCARQKRFSPALDREGRPVATSQLVVVRF
jgi:periplasmic protein TonB